jgi:putative spermidine/putrescine transport system substrate-binding protein
MKRSSALALTLGATVAALALATVASRAEETITMSMDGGSFEEGMREAVLNDAEKELGIKIVVDANTGNGLADIRAQVQSGHPTYDVMIQGDYGFPLAAREGLLEKLDYSVIKADGVPESSKADTCIAAYEWATVIGYNTESFPEGKPHPHGWATLWDVSTYPGERSLRRRPMVNLEAALIADGVAPADVYTVLKAPDGVDRAFKKLEELKPHVAAWWTSGAQSVQLLDDAEATAGTIWDGTVTGAMTDGAKINYDTDQEVIQFDCWAIPKGSAHVATAQKLIAYMMRPEVQARYAQVKGGSAPSNLDAYKNGLIPADVAASFPTSPEKRKTAIVLDAKWWSENIDKIEPRFTEFLQQ